MGGPAPGRQPLPPPRTSTRRRTAQRRTPTTRGGDPLPFSSTGRTRGTSVVLSGLPHMPRPEPLRAKHRVVPRAVSPIAAGKVQDRSLVVEARRTPAAAGGWRRLARRSGPAAGRDTGWRRRWIGSPRSSRPTSRTTCRPPGSWPRRPVAGVSAHGSAGSATPTPRSPSRAPAPARTRAGRGRG